MSYYNVKVAVSTSASEDTKGKIVSELYLVEALSCTEAQAKVHTDFSEFGNDFEITSTTKTKVVKVIE